jgi:sarcosine oxidase subunit gamma
MPDETVHRRESTAGQAAGWPAAAASTEALQVRWAYHQAIVNLRGDPDDQGFVAAVSAAMGLPLPTTPGDCPTNGTRRIVWAGPDDWFVIGEPGAQEAIALALREAAGARHHAVTDVSSGYAVLSLAGAPVRDVLAQGCPLDLHPRAFAVGSSAGTHYFKASVWLWRTPGDAFELLVRSSFAGYVERLLRASSLECGMMEG